MLRIQREKNMRDGTKLRGIHVLVIEDDQLTRHFLRSVLESSGAIVTAVATADAVRAALIADVMVCDLASAELAGREFLPQLQSLHARIGRAVPVVAMVPPGTPGARARAAGFGMSVVKPVDVDELGAMVLEATRH